MIADVPTRRRPISVYLIMRVLRGAGLTVLIILALTFSLLPIVWMAGTSFKSPGEFTTRQPTLLPRSPTTQHYERLWAEGFPRRLENSLVVTTGATLISLLVGFCAAYSLTRFRFPARLDVLFLFWVLLIKMIPPIVIAIPLYQVLRLLGLLNTLPGLVLVYQVYTLPYCIWLLLGFVRDVPIDLEEAAAIDGASAWQTMRSIVLPLVAPGLVATAIFSAILAWNEFLYALLFLHSPGLFTLPIHIANYITEHETLWGRLMGIGLLSSLPVLILSGFIQRYLIRGFAMGLK
jgi:multiple sugar transport system permease protein